VRLHQVAVPQAQLFQVRRGYLAAGQLLRLQVRAYVDDDAGARPTGPARPQPKSSGPFRNASGAAAQLQQLAAQLLPE